MDNPTLVQYLMAFMMDVAIIAGIPLAIATAASLLVSVFQAVTHIQDQTLAQLAKLVVICLVFLLGGAQLVSSFLNNSQRVFDSISIVGQ